MPGRMRFRRAARVILIGAPGVGKGTQSERLLLRYPQLKSLSSGDLLRSNVKNRTPLGVKVESTLKAGALVPDDLILRLISDELLKRGWLAGEGESRPITHQATSNKDEALQNGSDSTINNTASNSSSDPSASFILDGFPRTAAQAAMLDKIIPINLVVSIKTPFDVLLQRITGRWIHEPSGRVYNTSFNAPKVPGIDDITGEPLTQRPDDSEEVYRARYKKFEETSVPLLEHYARNGVLWEAEGLSSDDISPKLYKEFERRFAL